jgi:uncharacterized membrane protein YqjE
MTNAETERQLPTLGRLARRTLATFVGAVENRAELFTVEFEEENDRLLKMVIIGMSAVFLGMMGLLLVTGTIIFLVPEPDRVYAAIGFSVLYLGGAVAAVLTVKSLVKKAPFTESLNQLKKDSELLDAFK